MADGGRGCQLAQPLCRRQLRPSRLSCPACRPGYRALCACVRARGVDPVRDARAWTHGCADARQRVLRAEAEGRAHAGRALTHLMARAVEG